jgi:endonuclease/exonuclease/phosphatase (EEP) superfamily protein YafD
MPDIQMFKSLFASFIFWFWFGVWTFGVCLILVGVLRWWSGDYFLPVRLCTYLMPWLLVGTLTGIGVSLLTGRYRLALLLVVPTLFIIVSYAPLFLPAHDSLQDGFKLKVMSYNVWRENSDTHAMAEVIRKQKPDLILLQEIHRDKFRRLVSELDALYPNEPRVIYEEDKLQAIVSRFPVTRVDAGKGKGRAQKAVVGLPVGPITVLNVHPYRGWWQRRHKQMTTLIADDISETINPLILGGDFNTTDHSQTYRLFEPMLKNAHWQAGWGFGFTYPTPYVKFLRKLTFPPLVRIDHIFHSKHFVTQTALTLHDSGGSDHFPIIAELILKNEKDIPEN